MGDRLEAFEIEPSYEREDPFPRGPRVLWGRVAALGAGLVLFFLLGHMTAGGGGSSSQVTALQRQVDQDKATIAQLEQNLAQQNTAPLTTPTPATSQGAINGPGALQASPTASATSTSGSTSTSGTSPANGGTVTYTVKVGDTIGSIASHFYGHTQHDYVVAIEQANNLPDATIRVGMKLIIPPKPASTSGTTPTGTATTTPAASPTTRATSTPRASQSP